jgi:hypothetical protein
MVIETHSTTSDVQRPNLRRRLRQRFATFAPGPWAWSGAAIGALVGGTVCGLVIWGGLYLGFGRAADISIYTLACLLTAVVVTAVVAAATWLVRLFPVRVIAALIGSVLALAVTQIVMSGNFNPQMFVVTPLIPLEALFGLALGAIVGGELARGSRGKKIGIVSLLVVTLAANVALVIWLLGPGSDGHLVAYDNAATTVEPLSAPDPGQPGTLRVKAIAYGSGNDRHRPEFGSDVPLVTEPVDASLLIEDLSGFQAGAREWFWGFDVKRLPLNARVWYPEGPGPYPLVLIVHGNHTMEEFSDSGYEYLGEHLASRGYVVASLDENFLNTTWSGDLRGKELPARAWFMLKHLAQWHAWQQAEKHELFKRVDLQRIALVGHSRGGEAAALAAAFNRLPRHPHNGLLKFDFNFPIKTVIAIAPSHNFYKPGGESVRVRDLDYFVIQGAHDADVATFLGSCQYDGVTFSGDAPHFKCAWYVDRANHGQFNSVWGERDWGGLLQRLQNVKPLVTGDQQRQLAKVAIGAVLAASLEGKREYLTLLRNPRAGAAWLPDVACVARYNDSTFRSLGAFDEDVDLTTGTLPGTTIETRGLKAWREEKIPLRSGDDDQENVAVRLAWEKRESADSRAEFTLRLSDKAQQALATTPHGTLRFALAAAEPCEQPLAVTLSVESSTGGTVELPLAGGVPTPIQTQISKLPWVEFTSLTPYEIVLKTYDVPLADLAKQAEGWDPAGIRAITFRFDTTNAGTVYLDDVGLAGELR